MKSRHLSFCHPLHILALKSLSWMCYNKEIIVETKICLDNMLDHYPSTANNNKKSRKNYKMRMQLESWKIKNYEQCLGMLRQLILDQQCK